MHEIFVEHDKSPRTVTVYINNTLVTKDKINI